MTKPSRSLSKGREAFSGVSFLRDKALSEQKPPTPKWVIELSVPPASIISASPYWIIRKASPMAFEPEAQAVVTQEFGPFRPKSIETCPAASFTIISGTRSEEHTSELQS